MTYTFCKNEGNNNFDGLFNHTFYYFQPSLLIPLLNNTASSYFYGYPDYLINPFIKDVWHSEDIPNSNVIISLINFQFKPISYSLKSRIDFDTYFPLQWKLEGSNDCSTWVDLSNPPLNNDLNGRGFENNYKITQNNNQYFNFFKITGLKNTIGNYFILSHFELFGCMKFERISKYFNFIKPHIKCKDIKDFQAFLFTFLFHKKQ